MAQIVLGLGTSHAPSLSSPADRWPQAGEMDKQRELYDLDGRYVSYEELLSTADPSIAKELTWEKFQARHEACQRAIAKVGETLAQVAPDVLVMIGDDQKELFDEGNMPPVLVYWGETFLNLPHGSARAAAPPQGQSAAGLYVEEEKSYPVAWDLGRHLIEYLMEEGFDVAHSRYLKPSQGMGHAFAFVYRRLMNGGIIPVVPIMLNTYYPPNQPTPKRCYDLGRALKGAIEAWESKARVAVIASGGLSHFHIDEELDRRVIKALQDNDVEVLSSLPRKRLQSGTSEIRNWIVAAGAVEHLVMELIDYVPCYRTPAGTGVAMGFAHWS